MTGICAECGPVELLARMRKGERIVRCAVKRRSEHQHERRPGKHGLQSHEAEALKAGQLCAICESKERLVVDHCHKTKVIRGVLCTPCNIGLGHFADDPERLAKAIEYLKRQPPVL